MISLATVLLDPFTAALFGSLLAIASAGLVTRAPAVEVPRVARWAAVWGLLYSGCVGWFYFHYPDWMFAYLWDSRSVPLLPVYLLFALLVAGFATAAALGGAALVLHGRRGAAWGLLAFIAVAHGAVWALQLKQYVQIGTLEEFLSGHARPFQPEGDLKWPMTLSTLVAATGAVALLARQFLRGRKPAA